MIGASDQVEGGAQVRRKWKTLSMAVMAAVLTAMVTGCAGPKLALDPQALYALPELPAKYTELSGLLNAVLNEGAEYAAPVSGERIQPVQLVDLDGDGDEEAVAFFRSSGDEKPLKVCVFDAEGESYRLLDRIEGPGTSVWSVDYKDLDGDGTLEILVGWKATAELQVLEVYALGEGGARSLVRTDYVRYAVADLDGDGRQGLVVLRSGEDGGGVAGYYSWTEDGGLDSRSPVKISSTMAEVSQQGRLRQGALRDGAGALFVTGVTDLGMAVTDILSMRRGEIGNIVLSETTGISSAIAPFYALYPTDIDGDGVTEVPHPVPLLPPGETEGLYRMVEWCSYDSRGVPEVSMRTYHDLDDGWYVQIPDEWVGRFYVSRSSGASESAVTFYVREEDGRTEGARPFLRISALTGSGREMRSVRGERSVLSRQPETIYTAELLDGGGPFELTEDQVRAAFSLILREWRSSDN